jgi:hypothetical protein
MCILLIETDWQYSEILPCFFVVASLQQITFFPRIGLSLFDYSWHRWYIILQFQDNNVQDPPTIQWRWKTYTLMRHENMHWRYWKGQRGMYIHNQMFERMDLLYDLDLHDLYYTQVGGRTPIPASTWSGHRPPAIRISGRRWGMYRHWQKLSNSGFIFSFSALSCPIRRDRSQTFTL